MIVAGRYSHNGGQGVLERDYANELNEIYRVIDEVHASACKTKISRERRTEGELLYSPVALNKAFKTAFTSKGWNPVRVACDYPTTYYTDAYIPSISSGSRPYREMDFIKNNVGVEVQLGKYAFMVYNVSAKMTIFHNLGYINVGVEIVPIKALADNMSSGVSYFEQLVWDLTHRGVADIDIPVLILGIAPERE